jgi:hypothetical protein
LIVDLFRALLIAQPFLWIWIIEDDRWEFLNDQLGLIQYMFEKGSMVALFLVVGFSVEIGFYSTGLLTLYIFMVWMSYTWMMENHNFSFRKAIANSFLIVYLNSWYWESFLHIWAIQENGFNTNQLFQLLHLIPAVYFLIRYRFDAEYGLDEFGKGFFVSAMIGFIRVFRMWKYLPIVHTTQSVFIINQGLMILNRLICWIYLFRLIVIWGMHKSDYRKLMRQTQLLYTD